MTAESLFEKRNEFQSHVWDHSKDEFQIAFNTRERLTKAEQELLMEVLNSMANGATDSEMVEILGELLAPKPDDILILMQIVGLTRNKIVQDLKPGLRKIGISVHEAEGRLAVLLQSLDLGFEPKEKATNPLCPDAKVCDVSFLILLFRRLLRRSYA